MSAVSEQNGPGRTWLRKRRGSERGRVSRFERKPRVFDSFAKKGFRYFLMSFVLMLLGAVLAILGARFDDLIGLEFEEVEQTSITSSLISAVGIGVFMTGTFRYAAQTVGKLFLFFRGRPR